jgi:CDGSH-type Zn-finger protein
MPITIRLRPSGPLVVEGDFRLIDHEGNEFKLPTNKPVVALCRCGQSKTKPFCDGTHKTCGFAAVELAPSKDSSSS